MTKKDLIDQVTSSSGVSLSKKDPKRYWRRPSTPSAKPSAKKSASRTQASAPSHCENERHGKDAIRKPGPP
ncbi:hypothetical protein GBAR_LOCUS8344 [Geodia barretti]|uniref:Uncharacterized protein n=1 Tax=Geodia barretti TaxID=519541 RepID=A0AA35WG20_GEOBA|nr:hypothetical protein GBAR_LOCUS8344 [Geodia barretti]